MLYSTAMPCYSFICIVPAQTEQRRHPKSKRDEAAENIVGEFLHFEKAKHH